MRTASHASAASGFPMRWEPWETEIGEPGALFADGSSAEFAADALFYGGWYNYAKYQHAWQWKAGSFACDLNSNSAQGLRDAGTVSFLCQAFQENLTAGAGVIAEPYLNGHNRPDVFLAYILDGYPWAEVSMVSDNAMKWMGLHVGDPLYRIDLANAVADTVGARALRVAGRRPRRRSSWSCPRCPTTLPGGDEVFRIIADRVRRQPAVLASPVVAARRSPPAARGRAAQRRARPHLRAGRSADPSGNVGVGPLLHFLAGPARPSPASCRWTTPPSGPASPPSSASPSARRAACSAP